MGRLGRQDNDLFGERPASLPSGIVLMHAGSSAPSGWLLCDGSAVSRSDYANLFAVIGVSYGAGNGTTTFNLPDLRGRFPVGRAASGTFATLGSTGGAETVALTAAQSGTAAHTHAATGAATAAGGHAHSGGTSSGGGHGHSASTGGSGSHSHSVNQSYIMSLNTGTAGNGGGTTIVNSGNASSPSTNGGGDHTHSVSVSSGGDHSHSFGTSTDGFHGHSVSISISNAAASNAAEAHQNLPPYLVVNCIIKT